MKWLRKILGLCDHRWEILVKHRLTYEGMACGSLYIQQCKNCGKLKKYKVEV